LDGASFLRLGQRICVVRDQRFLERLGRPVWQRSRQTTVRFDCRRRHRRRDHGIADHVAACRRAVDRIATSDSDGDASSRTGVRVAVGKKRGAANFHRRSFRDSPSNVNGKSTDGGVLAGITHVIASPYLASICLFLVLVQGCGTQLYFEQAEIIKATIEGTESRTKLFAYLDLGTQVLTLIVQAFCPARSCAGLASA
jgi:hypothetical protein